MMLEQVFVGEALLVYIVTKPTYRCFIFQSDLLRGYHRVVNGGEHLLILSVGGGLGLLNFVLLASDDHIPGVWKEDSI
jgi:hypothetical protein